MYKAKHRVNGSKRAIKTIPKDKIQNVERFKNEIEALKVMDHPNVVMLSEIFEDSRRVYLV